MRQVKGRGLLQGEVSSLDLGGFGPLDSLPSIQEPGNCLLLVLQIAASGDLVLGCNLQTCLGVGRELIHSSTINNE